MPRFIGLTATLLIAAQVAAAQDYLSSPADPQAAVTNSDGLQQQIDELRARFAALEKDRSITPNSNTFVSTEISTDTAIQQPAISGAALAAACCAPEGAWVGGATLYVLRPHWSSGNTAFVTAGLAFPPTLNVTTTTFNNNYQAAPGAWFGYVHSSGYGLRVNYFQFNQTTGSSGTPSGLQIIVDPSDSNFTFPGSVFTATSTLAINFWDLEATKRVNLWNWNWTGSAGLRYLYLNQTYQGGDGFSSLATRQFFNGAGPTAALQGRRPIGGRGLGFYGGARGSLAFGTSNQTSTLAGGGAPPFNFSNSNRSVLPVAEVEFGVDYRRRLGRVTLLIENSLIGQAYFDVGSSSGFSDAISPTVPGFFAYQSNATLGMFGLRSSFGLTF